MPGAYYNELDEYCARVAKLRAIGNAIDPRPAAEFIGAARDAIEVNI